MHKTPGKWIKSILSGKRSSKSALSKARAKFKSANEEGTLVSGKLLVYSAENSPLTSHPATTVAGNELEPNSENRTVAEVPEKVVNLSGGKEAEDAQVASFFDSLDGPERIRHEQAARKVQAAFRGYLARRAFRALKGIIRLQAVIRGHLVRRQAVATLYCVLGIVRFQALVRGQKVRHTVTGVKVQRNSCLAVNLNANHSMTSALADKLSQNAFAQKLLASSPAAMPLRLQYGQEDANSSWKWLQCWTISHIWSVRSQRKINSESHLKNGSLHAVGSEQGRLKRDLQKPSAANREDCLTRSPSESEKFKHGTRKVSKCSVESIQGRPENEIQKVRHNLRRISNTSLAVSDRLETDVHKTKCAQRKVSTSVAIEASEVGGLDISESMKKDVAVIELKQLGEETSRKSLTAVEPVDKLCDQFQECDGIETNKGFVSNDNQVSNEKPKSCKRRASLPGKQDNQENGLQVTPRLPSYMATTESAKAKLRGQTSPKVGRDETEKNGFTRRHSLPSSLNGKLNSLSPRVQKLVHSNGRGSLRSDKSLSSSRDEKAIQSEWRR